MVREIYVFTYSFFFAKYLSNKAFVYMHGINYNTD